MRKILLGIFVVCLTVSALALYSAHVFANDMPKPSRHFPDFNFNRDYNPDNQLSNSACGKGLRNPVINVVQKVQQDAD